MFTDKQIDFCVVSFLINGRNIKFQHPESQPGAVNGFLPFGIRQHVLCKTYQTIVDKSQFLEETRRFYQGIRIFQNPVKQLSGWPEP